MEFENKNTILLIYCPQNEINTWGINLIGYIQDLHEENYNLIFRGTVNDLALKFLVC